MDHVSIFFERAGNIVCEYGSFEETLAMVHKTSFLMGLIFFAISIFYKDITLWVTTKALLAFQFIIWCFQVVVNDVREDFWCRGQYSYAIPNMEIFYVWFIGWVLVCFYFVWKWSLGWFRWLLLIIWFILTPTILVWTDHLAWWEVLLSVGLAVIAGSVYVYIFKTRICTIMPTLLNMWPVTIFGLKDIFDCMNEREKSKFLRLVKLEKDLRKGRSGRKKSRVFGEWGY